MTQKEGRGCESTAKPIEPVLTVEISRKVSVFSNFPCLPTGERILRPTFADGERHSQSKNFTCMNGLAANKSFDGSGRFIPPPTTQKSGGFEGRLAVCLHNRRRKSRSPETKIVADKLCDLATSTSHGTSTSIEAAINRLLGTSDNPDGRSSVSELCRTLESAGERRRQLKRPFDRTYGERLQLAAILPIFLNADAADIGPYIAKSTQLAAEASVFLELNDVLDHELFTLINTNTYKPLHPEAVIKLTFDFKLSLVASVTPENSAEIDERTRQAYWMIAEQVVAGATHLHVPSNLDVGKIAWPRVREHWQQLNSILLSDPIESKPTGTAMGTANRSLSTTPPSASASNAKLESTTFAKKATEVEASIDTSSLSNQDFIEIRSSNDPRLAETLAIQLDECRDNATAMGLAVFQRVGAESCLQNRNGQAGPIQPWHAAVLDCVQRATTGLTSRGFLSDCGDLALVFEHLDRNDLTNLIRNVLEDVAQTAQPSSRLVEASKIGLVAGIACVESPSKRFKIDQLIEASWRCLTAAKNQGLGSVKSIEVY